MPPEIDLLAPFRAPGARPIAPPPRAQSGYRAFLTANSGMRPVRFEIRPKTGMAVARPYSAILEIAYDRGVYTGILLVLPGGTFIKIRGRYLQPVVESLIAGTCECIVEIKDGDRMDDGVPVIDRIEILSPQTKETSPP